jgi:hypothetical protein
MLDILKNGDKIEQMLQDKKNATRLICSPLHLDKYFLILSKISGVERHVQ